MSDKRGELSVNVNVNVPGAQQLGDGEPPYTTTLGYGLWCACLVGACVRMNSLVSDANIREGRIPHPRQAALASVQAGGGKPERALAKPLNLRQQLLKAAMDNGGDLTVSQGVLTTGQSFEEVEKVLNGMADKGYVDVDNAPGTGVIVYRFPELLGK